MSFCSNTSNVANNVQPTVILALPPSSLSREASTPSWTTFPIANTLRSRFDKGSVKLLMQEDRGHGLHGIVYSSSYNGTKLVIKLFKEYDSGEFENEASIYSKIDQLGLDVAPVCYGAFAAPSCKILVLEDVGHPISSFAELSEQQR